MLSTTRGASLRKQDNDQTRLGVIAGSRRPKQYFKGADVSYLLKQAGPICKQADDSAWWISRQEKAIIKQAGGGT
ncbi:unnamed protein product [Linum trigynum]|uniref:Uncharacterized protein n=1 Tax=Linum trigynum TaxID=586398 RepID=A0AAV2DC17_9ROSI